jgi:hypothetical protein
MAINNIPGVGPQNSDIAAAVAAPSAATIAAAVAAPSSSTIATAVAAAVPTSAQITTIVQNNAGSPVGGTWTNIGYVSGNGASSASFTGLSSYKYLKVYFLGIYPSVTNVNFTMRINSDSGNNYWWIGNKITEGSASPITVDYGGNSSYHYMGGIASGYPTSTQGMFEIKNSNTGVYKTYKFSHTYFDSGQGANRQSVGVGQWNSTSAITSITFSISGGTFLHSNGTYGFYLAGAN